MDAQVDAVNRYLGSTTGREKLCRLVQYFARFYAFYLFRKGAPKDVVERWAELKQHIGNGRKFFRLFKPIEFFQTAVHTANTRQDDFIRLTTISKHVFNAFYYLSEVFVLTTAINFYQPKAIKQITKFGQECWFTSLFASILCGLYKLCQLQRQGALVDQEKKAYTKETHSVSYQLLQDIVDIIIPSGNLGWLPVDEGIIGIAGIITSSMAMKSQWEKVNP